MPLEFIERTVAARAARSGSPSGCGEYAAAGVTTLSVSPYVGDLESGIATLRTVAEAYEESGVAE